MRWREDGRLVQEATEFKVGTKADKARAEARLEERTAMNRMKRRRDRLAVLIAERDELAAKIARMEAKAQPAKEMLKLGGLVEAWRRSPRRKDCSNAQRARYESQIAAFVRWAGEGVAFAAVDDRMAEDYAVALGKRASGNTYNKHINTLTAAWKAVGRSEGVRENPWADISRRRLETHARRGLTADETARILGEAKGELKGLLLIGLRLGLRMGDAARLRWEAFKDDGTVEVKTSKTGTWVRLPAARLVADLGEAGIGRKAKGEVLPGIAERYRQGAGAGISKAVERVMERAGIATSERREGWGRARPTASFHSLRHMFVTRAIEAGVPAAIVRALVGHSTAAMTEHYTHVSAAAMVEAFARMG